MVPFHITTRHRRAPEVLLPCARHIPSHSPVAALRKLLPIPILLLPTLLATHFCHAAPQRVVSINLCSDQLLLLLGAPSQITSISYLARDPNASWIAERAGRFPVNHASLEEIIGLHPDLILSGAYTDTLLRRALKQLGYRVESIPLATSIAGIRDNIRRVAALIGRKSQGERLIADLDTRLAKLRQHRFSRRPRALFYQPNGYTAGDGTLQDEALRLAGWENLAVKLGIQGYAPIDLESLLLAQPEQFFTSPYAPGTQSLAQHRLRHPALRAVTGGKPMRVMPYRYWLCGGPMIADAIERLRQVHP